MDTTIEGLAKEIFNVVVLISEPEAAVAEYLILSNDIDAEKLASLNQKEVDDLFVDLSFASRRKIALFIFNVLRPLFPSLANEGAPLQRGARSRALSLKAMFAPEYEDDESTGSRKDLIYDDEYMDEDDNEVELPAQSRILKGRRADKKLCRDDDKYLDPEAQAYMDLDPEDDDAEISAEFVNEKFHKRKDFPSICSEESVVVGVCGQTGAGKSSLLNVMLPGNVLPTSAMHACTAVAMEMRYHAWDSVAHLADHKFRAEIVLTSPEEWMGQVKLAMMSKEGENQVVVDRVKAVYGRLYPTLEEFTRFGMIITTLNHLGKEIQVHSGNGIELRKQISDYVATGSDRSGSQIWPLVKMVRIFGPWKMLSKGLVLVDLPGLGDSNAARNGVVDAFVDACDGVMIVSRIHRAKDDQVVKDLLLDRLRDRLFSGSLKYAFVVLTQSDQLQPWEIIEELKLNVSAVQAEVKSTTLALSRLEKSSTHTRWQEQDDVVSQANSELCTRRIALERSLAMCEPEATIEACRVALNSQTAVVARHKDREETLRLNFQGEQDQMVNLQSHLESLNFKIRNSAALARNDFLSVEINKDFQSEIKDLVIAHDLPPPKELALQVFPISSREYARCSISEDMSDTFAEISETGVPPLMKQLAAITGVPEASLEFVVDLDGDEEDETTHEDIDVSEFLSDDLRNSEKEYAEYLSRRKEEQKIEFHAQQERLMANMDATMVRTTPAAYVKAVRQRNDSLEKMLGQLLGRLDETAASKEQLGYWRAQLKKASDAGLPNVTIGVLGATGAGKSSLINALLGKQELLPTSGIRACTSAVIEISYGIPVHGAAYSAHVEFLSLQEWNEEMYILMEDLKDADGKFATSRPTRPTGRVAWDKLESVYGEMRQIHKIPERGSQATSMLGMIVPVSAHTAKVLKAKIEQYASSSISESSREDSDIGTEMLGKLWPLVKLIRVRGPFNLLKSSECKLVDLPGLADSNSARCKVAQDYIQKCNAFLIAAKIERAVDNQIAKHLLGEQFKRQMLMDCNLGSIAFVATQTDNISAKEVFSEFGASIKDFSGDENAVEELQRLLPKMALMEKKLKKLSKAISSNNSIVKRNNKNLNAITSTLEELNAAIKSAGSSNDRKSFMAARTRNNRSKRSALGNIRAAEANLKQLRKIQAPISKHYRYFSHQANFIAARARNVYSRMEIAKDFADGFSGMEVEIPPLPVFTVSSADYQLLSCTPPKMDQASAFYNVEDTGVSQLRSYIQHVAEVGLYRIERGRNRALGLIVQAFGQYFQMDEQISESARRQCIDAMTAAQSERLDSLSKLGKGLKASLSNIMLKGPLMERISVGAASAEKNASKNYSHLSGRLHFMTYRAAMSRSGLFQSPTFGLVDFNGTLSKPIFDSSSATWNQVFMRAIPNLLDKFKESIMVLMNKMLVDIRTKFVSLGFKNEKLLQRLLDTISSATFEAGLDKCLANIVTLVENRQKGASRVTPEIVKTALSTGYSRAGMERGTGMLNRMKSHMSSTVALQRGKMFKKCHVAIQSEVDVMISEVDKNMAVNMKDFFASMMSGIRMVIDSNCELPKPTVDTLVAFLDQLQVFAEKVQVCTSALCKATDSIDFVNPAGADLMLPMVSEISLDPSVFEPVDKLLPQPRVPTPPPPPRPSHTPVRPGASQQQPKYPTPKPVNAAGRFGVKLEKAGRIEKAAAPKRKAEYQQAPKFKVAKTVIPSRYGVKKPSVTPASGVTPASSELPGLEGNGPAPRFASKRPIPYVEVSSKENIRVEDSIEEEEEVIDLTGDDDEVDEVISKLGVNNVPGASTRRHVKME